MSLNGETACAVVRDMYFGLIRSQNLSHREPKPVSFVYCSRKVAVTKAMKMNTVNIHRVPQASAWHRVSAMCVC